MVVTKIKNIDRIYLIIIQQKAILMIHLNQIKVHNHKEILRLLLVSKLKRRLS